MTHARQQIRDSVASTLEVIGPTIYTTRRHALDDSALPAICIYTTDEQSRLVTIGTRTLRRDLSLVIDIAAAGSSETIENTLDDYCASVEALLGNDWVRQAGQGAFFISSGVSAPSLSMDFVAPDPIGAKVKDIILQSTEVSVNVDGKKAIGVATMTYGVVYITTNTDAETTR